MFTPINLRCLRAELQLSQKGLAHATGISHHKIRSFERGKSPLSPEELYKLEAWCVAMATGTTALSAD